MRQLNEYLKTKAIGTIHRDLFYSIVLLRERINFKYLNEEAEEIDCWEVKSA